MTGYELWSIAVAFIALGLSLVSVLVSVLYNRSLHRQAKRSADAAEAAYRLQIVPHVIAYVGPTMEQTQIRLRQRNAVVVENKGNGPAFCISGELWVSADDGQPQCQPLSHPALRSGDQIKITAGIPWQGKVAVWGVIECEDQRGVCYKLRCERGQAAWR